MRRCIVHVGMHKTGTSSIQQSLNGFADDAFVYADVDGHPNHTRVLKRLVEVGGDPGPATDADRTVAEAGAGSVFADALPGLVGCIEQLGNRTLILSGEGISLFSPEDLARLRNWLRRWFAELEIVAAVRSPAGFMASAFQEGLKRGGRDQLDIARQYRSYRGTFEKFDLVYGRENVRLWKFDPKSFASGCAVQDFCRRLGVELPAARVVRVNESLSREAVSLLYIYRKLGHGLGSMSMTGPQNAQLVKCLMGIGKGKFRFSAGLVGPVLERNRADIDWMEARLGASLDEGLGEALPGDIGGEADLLTPSPVAVSELLSLLGEAAPAGVAGVTPEEVAQLVHALRRGPARRRVRSNATADAQPRSAAPAAALTMTVTDLLQRARQANPERLEGVAVAAGQALAGSLLHCLRDILANSNASVVDVAGLGRFRRKLVQGPTEGQRSRGLHFIFRPGETGGPR